MEIDQELTILGWPALSLPLPVYVRWRFRLDGRPNGLRAEPVARETKVAPGDTCLRLVELDRKDQTAVLAFLNDVGAPLDVAASESSLADLEGVVAVVRDAVVAWRILAGDPWPTGLELGSTAFAGQDPTLLRRQAAEFLSATLTQGLRPLHPVVWLGYGAFDRELASARDISLETLCFAEIYRHVIDRASYRRCLNESCERLFAADAAAAKSGRRRSLYCSRACAHAQAQREFRRRRAQSSVPT